MYLVILISPSVTQDAGSGRFLEDRETASDSQRERESEGELVEKNCVANCWKLAPDSESLSNSTLGYRTPRYDVRRGKIVHLRDLSCCCYCSSFRTLVVVVMMIMCHVTQECPDSTARCVRFVNKLHSRSAFSCCPPEPDQTVRLTAGAVFSNAGATRACSGSGNCNTLQIVFLFICVGSRYVIVGLCA